MLKHVLEWDLYKSNSSKLSHSLLTVTNVLLLIGVLDNFYNLESEEWKSKNLFLEAVVRHVGSGKFNLSWW